MKVIALQNIIYDGNIKNIGDVFDILEKGVFEDCIKRNLVQQYGGNTPISTPVGKNDEILDSELLEGVKKKGK